MVFGAIAGATASATIDAVDNGSGGIINRIFQVLLITFMLGALALLIYILLLVGGSDLVSLPEGFSFWSIVGLDGFIDESSSIAATGFTILTAGFSTLWGRRG